MIATPDRRAFTIVEMLVVIGIIALLLGILLPALSGVQKRSAKTREINGIRSIGQAWALYANFNADAALPGYLEWQPAPGIPSVQQFWRVKYEFPTPYPVTGERAIPEDIAAPWTWRLAPYIDSNHELIWGYRREVYDAFTLVESAPDVALEPAFGYNGYYVGGYWDTEQIVVPADEFSGGGTFVRSRLRFGNATTMAGNPVTVVSRTLPSIQRTTELVIFCSSTTYQGPNITYQKVDDDRPGFHLVTPPILADVAQWVNRGLAGGGGPSLPSGGVPSVPGGGGGATATRAAADGPNTITALVNQAHAPLGRYTGYAAVLYADGHSDVQSISDLSSVQPWIDTATSRTFRHNP